MKSLMVISVLFFSALTQAMPQVLECSPVSGSGEYILKGLEKADSGDGFKSYSFVNMVDDSVTVLSVGILGQDQADGFVAFSGFMDQFSESVIARLCTEDVPQEMVKTLVLKLAGGNAGAAPLCLACLPE